jgi:hypothetical protein
MPVRGNSFHLQPFSIGGRIRLERVGSKGNSRVFGWKKEGGWLDITEESSPFKNPY